MNRRYKFRGKSIHTNEWAYGNLRIFGERAYISAIDSHAQSEVALESVGQYTGLRVIDYVEVYEGDIVEACFKYEGLGANGGVIPDQDCIVHGVVVWEDCDLMADFPDIYTIACFRGNTWHFTDEYFLDCKVDRWMPIPDTPQPESNFPDNSN